MTTEEKTLEQMLFEQAKKCQTASGGGLLLAIKGFLSGYVVYEGCDELWQVVDVLASNSEMGERMSEPYRRLTCDEKDDRYDDTYDVLVGPDGFKCFLGEPEGCTWSRDGKKAVVRLNEQHEEIERLRSRLNEARALAKELYLDMNDNSNTYFVVAHPWLKE